MSRQLNRGSVSSQTLMRSWIKVSGSYGSITVPVFIYFELKYMVHLVFYLKDHAVFVHVQGRPCLQVCLT